MDVHLGRRGPQQRQISTGDALESSSPGLRMHSLALMQAVASSSVLPRLPCRLAGSPRDTPALGLWGCCGGVYTRTGVCQTPCRRVWDEGLWYPSNGTSLIPVPRVGLLELPRPRTVQIWVLPRNQGPRPRLPLSPRACQPIGSCVSIRTPLSRSAHVPGHMVLHRRRVCFPGDLHAPPIGTGHPPWP